MSSPPEDDVPEVEPVEMVERIESLPAPYVEAAGWDEPAAPVGGETFFSEPVPSLVPGRHARHSRPRPGVEFLMGLAWCVALWAVMILGMIVGGVPTVIVLLVSAPAGTDPADLFDMRPGGPVPPAVAYLMVAAMAAAQLAAYIFTRILVSVRIGPRWRAAVALRRPRFEAVVLALLVLPGLMVGHGLVHEFIQWVFPTGEGASESNRLIGEIFAQVPVWLAIVVIGVMPGVVEELFCRGYLAWGLTARAGVTAGIIMTSVLFGLLHLDPRYAFGTAVMGLMLHLVLRASGSLWITILLHMLNNSLSVIGSTGEAGKPIDETGTPWYLGLAAVANILVVGLVWGLSRSAPEPPSTSAARSAMAWGDAQAPLPRARPGLIGWLLAAASCGGTVWAAIAAG